MGSALRGEKEVLTLQLPQLTERPGFREGMAHLFFLRLFNSLMFRAEVLKWTWFKSCALSLSVRIHISSLCLSFHTYKLRMEQEPLRRG